MDFYWISGVLPATNEPVDATSRERHSYKVIDVDLAKAFIKYAVKLRSLGRRYKALVLNFFSY